MFEKVLFNIRNLGSGIPLFHFAAESNNLNMLRYCIETDKNSINQYDEYGRTPLHRAILNSCAESIVLLLEAGANPDLIIKDITFQKRPVELALRDKSTLQILIFYGAKLENVNLTSKVRPIQFGSQPIADFLSELFKKKADFEDLVSQAARELPFEQRVMCYYKAAYLCFEFAQDEPIKAYSQQYCYKSLELLEQAKKIFEDGISEDKNELGVKIFCLLADINRLLHNDKKAKEYSNLAAAYLNHSSELNSLCSTHASGDSYTELRRRKFSTSLSLAETEIEPLLINTDKKQNHYRK